MKIYYIENLTPDGIEQIYFIETDFFKGSFCKEHDSEEFVFEHISDSLEQYKVAWTDFDKWAICTRVF